MANLNNYKKDELIELLKEKDLESDSLKKIVEESEKKQKEKESEFQKQMEEMKSMMLALQSQQMSKGQETDSDDVTIYSNMIGKNSISIDRESAIVFTDIGAYETISFSEAKSLIRFANNKNLFTSGLLVFENEEDYKRFKIKPRKLLTDDYIIGLFELSTDKFVEELKEITNNKTDSPATHTIIYRIGLLYQKGMIRNITMDTQEAFRDYFGVALLDLNISFLIE